MSGACCISAYAGLAGHLLWPFAGAVGGTSLAVRHLPTQESRSDMAHGWDVGFMLVGGVHVVRCAAFGAGGGVRVGKCLHSRREVRAHRRTRREVSGIHVMKAGRHGPGFTSCRQEITRWISAARKPSRSGLKVSLSYHRNAMTKWGRRRWRTPVSRWVPIRAREHPTGRAAQAPACGRCRRWGPGRRTSLAVRHLPTRESRSDMAHSRKVGFMSRGGVHVVRCAAFGAGGGVRVGECLRSCREVRPPGESGPNEP